MTNDALVQHYISIVVVFIFVYSGGILDSETDSNLVPCQGVFEYSFNELERLYVITMGVTETLLIYTVYILHGSGFWIVF